MTRSLQSPSVHTTAGSLRCVRLEPAAWAQQVRSGAVQWQADGCRTELLVEIEAHAFAPGVLT